MAWAHVQSAGAGTAVSSGTVAVAYGGALTAGNLLVCTVGWYAAAGQTISGVSDGTQSWTQIGSTLTVASTGGNWSCALFYFPNNALTTAATVTATFSAATAFQEIAVSAYSGIATSSALDQTAGQAQVDPGTGTDAITSGSVTTGANNELIYGGALGVGTTDVLTVGSSPWTSRQAATDGVFSMIRVEDRNLSSAGSVAAPYNTIYTTADTCTRVATFKEPAAGASVISSLSGITFSSGLSNRSGVPIANVTSISGLAAQ